MTTGENETCPILDETKDEVFKSTDASDLGPQKNERGDSRLNAEENRRAHWATTALALMSYGALVGAVGVWGTGRWGAIGRLVSVALALALLAGADLIAVFGKKNKNYQMAKAFFFFGSLFFGLALTGLDYQFGSYLSAAEGGGRLVETVVKVSTVWALGTFAVAFAYYSRTLHFLAALALLFTISCRSGSTCASLLTLACCALGEYWARRRSSSSVASIYLFLSAWTAATFLVARRDLATTSLTIVLVAVSVYWAGVNFKNAILRGAAILMATVAFGTLTFPQCWRGTLDGLSSALVASFFAALFIVFCVNMILGGARASGTRFVFGVGATAIWTCLLIGFISRDYGASAAALSLIGVALVFTGLLALERLARSKRPAEVDPERARRALDFTATDALGDDPEFDDIFDKEARRLRENGWRNGRIFALADVCGECCDYVVAHCRKPLLSVMLGLRYIALVIWAF